MIFLKSSQYSKLISKLFFPSSQRSNSLLITQFFETIEKQWCKQKNNTVFFGGSTYLHFNIDDESQEVNFHVLSLNWKKNLPCGGLSRNQSRWFSVGFRRFSSVKKMNFPCPNRKFGKLPETSMADQNALIQDIENLEFCLKDIKNKLIN